MESSSQLQHSADASTGLITKQEMLAISGQERAEHTQSGSWRRSLASKTLPGVKCPGRKKKASGIVKKKN